MAKHYANLYIDFCWSWIIDPYGAKEALKTILGMVPSNKIFGFGGDLGTVDTVYGHSVMSREGINRCLQELQRDGFITLQQGFDIARRIL